MNSKVKSFRDLDVWKGGMAVTEQVYKLTEKWGRYDSLADQVQRAAVSIPANVAEGFGRQTTIDYLRFLQMGRGSLYELCTHLEIASRIGRLEKPVFDALQSDLNTLARQLNGLISSLRKRLAS